jgi:hypothetical protein
VQVQQHADVVPVQEFDDFPDAREHGVVIHAGCRLYAGP